MKLALWQQDGTWGRVSSEPSGVRCFADHPGQRASATATGGERIRWTQWAWTHTPAPLPANWVALGEVLHTSVPPLPRP